MSHSQSRMLQTKLIKIVWQTILLRDLDILRCSKGNVSLHWPIVGTQCYFLVQMMSSPKYISSSRRNVVGTDRVALGRPSCSPTSPLRRPRDPCAGYHSPYKAEPLHPNSPALERPSYPLHINFAATACEELYYFPSHITENLTRNCSFTLSCSGSQYDSNSSRRPL